MYENIETVSKLNQTGKCAWCSYTKDAHLPCIILIRTLKLCKKVFDYLFV